MDFKKTVLFGILMWLIVFVEVSIIGFSGSLATMGANGFEFTQTGSLVHLAAVILISVILAKLYYKKANVSFSDALMVAIGILVTGIILDAVITVPFFVKDYQMFFGDVNLWIGLILSALAFSVTASYSSMMKKKK